MAVTSDYIWYAPGTDTAYDLRTVVTFRQDETNPDIGWVRFHASNVGEVQVPWDSFLDAIELVITRVTAPAQFVANGEPFNVTEDGNPGVYESYQVVEE